MKFVTPEELKLASFANQEKFEEEVNNKIVNANKDGILSIFIEHDKKDIISNVAEKLKEAGFTVLKISSPSYRTYEENCGYTCRIYWG